MYKSEDIFELRPAPGEAPHELSENEIREKFLKHVWEMIEAWRKSGADPLAGLAFSILAAIDGASITVPGFHMIPVSDKTNIKSHKERGENWYPISPSTVKCDIAGGLHDSFYPVGRKLGYLK